ncbi:MAG: DeoR/GlpR transcriptional regulator [Propionibacteriaceae bacterium]|jgi:DeoR family fructose operon transcriptional repressor|nr:DeoR/GlpR transcriptional regulator [Propionibacteriaceae bacterium]
MYAEERQRVIVNLALRHERVSVTELAERFDVTTETIRRDLDALDRRGILRRVHGGAVVAESLSVVESAVTEREPAFVAQKTRIAQAALGFLPTGPSASAIFDAGTTVARLASAMPTGALSTVVTNSLSLAAQVALANGGTQVHLLGGRVRGITQACVGNETVARLAELRCDVAFLGTNGVSVARGFSTPDQDEAAVKRAMTRAARRVVVLADSSKLGVELLVTFAPLSSVDVLITDSGISHNDRADLVRAGLEVVIA